jgi:hypothetical protein
MSILKTLLVLVIFAGSAAAIIIGGASLSEGQNKKDMSEQIQAVMLVVIGVIGMFYLASSFKLV